MRDLSLVQYTLIEYTLTEYLRPGIAVKTIELMTMAALQESPLHGYALAARVAELTGGAVEVRPGNLYRVLYRLEEQGWVRETATSGDDERRTYALTAAGRRALIAELKMYAHVLARTGLHEANADA